ncbi:hypothetical protein SAMN05216224_1014 [Thioclava dalianensis]|nr:hypothetical protein SAMN05216224_1014 [Thioclava dalianensis]
MARKCLILSKVNCSNTVFAVDLLKVLEQRSDETHPVPTIQSQVMKCVAA